MNEVVTYPTADEVLAADKNQLKDWWRNLPQPAPKDADRRAIMALVEKRAAKLGVFDWRYLHGGN